MIGVQAFLLAQLGLRLGSRLDQRAGAGAERIAALTLIVLGILIAAETLLS